METKINDTRSVQDIKKALTWLEWDLSCEIALEIKKMVENQLYSQDRIDALKACIIRIRAIVDNDKTV